MKLESESFEKGDWIGVHRRSGRKGKINNCFLENQLIRD